MPSVQDWVPDCMITEGLGSIMKNPPYERDCTGRDAVESSIFFPHNAILFCVLLPKRRVDYGGEACRIGSFGRKSSSLLDKQPAGGRTGGLFLFTRYYLKFPARGWYWGVGKCGVRC